MTALAPRGASAVDPGRHGVQEAARIVRADADLDRHVDPAFAVQPERILDDIDRFGQRRRSGLDRVLIEKQQTEFVLGHWRIPYRRAGAAPAFIR